MQLGLVGPALTRSGRLALVLLGLALVWALMHFSGLRSRLSFQMLHDAFEQHRLGGLAVFTAAFIVGNLIQLPGWLFLATAVLTLGPLWGGAATYMAACVSCVVTYGVLRGAGGDALRGVGGTLGTRIFARLDAHPVQSVFLLRLLFQTVPALNCALALSGLKFRDYLLGTVTGLPLPILLYCVFFDSLIHWLGWPVH